MAFVNTLLKHSADFFHILRIFAQKRQKITLNSEKGDCI